jgi:sortase A
VAVTVWSDSGAPEAPQTSDAETSGLARSENGSIQAEPALVTRMLADLHAGRELESQDTPLAGAAVEVVRASPDSPVPIAALSIPAIDLKTKVYEGVNETALANGPGHWPGTPAPGTPGNFVLSGHRTTETEPFRYLDRLSKGDVITLTEGDVRHRYAVEGVHIVPEKRYVPYVLQQPKSPRAERVTLFACNPLTAHYQRIVVRAAALEGGRGADD